MKNKTTWFLIISSILFITMFLFLEFNYVEGIDLYSKSIQDFFKNSSFKTNFLFITNIMSVLGISIILGITIYFLRKEDAKKDIIIYITSIISCLIITNLIKIIVRRERPIKQLLEVSGYSFPSSHSSMSMVVYGFLILLIRKYYQGKFKNLYIIICLLLILLTGVSRVYFNVHYITDVIAGYSIGIIVLCISNYFLKKLTK